MLMSQASNTGVAITHDIAGPAALSRLFTASSICTTTLPVDRRPRVRARHDFVVTIRCSIPSIWPGAAAAVSISFQLVMVMHAIVLPVHLCRANVQRHMH